MVSLIPVDFARSFIVSESVEPTHGVGFVLSGGAARGAYEAGVLRFVLRDLAKRLGRPTWPDVVSGTSVGALNGVVAACRDPLAIDRLVKVWRELALHDVFEFKLGHALSHVIRDFLRPGRKKGGPEALIDPGPFSALLARELPERALRRAIDSGETRAFMVAATEVRTGLNALFVDSRNRLPLPIQAGSRVHAAQIGAAHCRASAAIPFIFPPVAINGRHYVDGGLRQNTPIRPVISTGVDRVLVIGLQLGREGEAVQNTMEAGATPSLVFLAGKMLDALMLDPVERDLWSARNRNAFLQWGRGRFGEEFVLGAERELGLREVELVHLRPSLDLGRLAGEIYQQRPPRSTRVNRLLLDFVANATGDLEADALSFLYFDREYTGALEQLGYEDARRSEAQLAKLFAPPSVL